MTDKRYSVIQAKFTRWAISPYNFTEFSTQEESNCHIKKLLNEPGCISDQFLLIDYGDSTHRLWRAKFKTLIRKTNCFYTMEYRQDSKVGI